MGKIGAKCGDQESWAGVGEKWLPAFVGSQNYCNNNYDNIDLGDNASGLFDASATVRF